jgi:hypothetical protein
MKSSEPYGFVGNIWVLQHYLELTGDTNGGHAHTHDHITLLTTGSVQVSVNDGEPKVFTAPTFIIIKKGLRHKLVALEDNTNYFCVFAMRDIDGDLTDIVDEAHLPNSMSVYNPEVYAQLIAELDKTNK